MYYSFLFSKKKAPKSGVAEFSKFCKYLMKVLKDQYHITDNYILKLPTLMSYINLWTNFQLLVSG